MRASILFTAKFICILACMGLYSCCSLFQEHAANADKGTATSDGAYQAASKSNAYRAANGSSATNGATYSTVNQGQTTKTSKEFSQVNNTDLDKALKPILTKQERIRFNTETDKVNNLTNSYFAIVGSYSTIDNANRAIQELASKGIRAFTLWSETRNFYRVCAGAYPNEQDARKSISSLQAEHPEYGDAWLLIQEK